MEFFEPDADSLLRTLAQAVGPHSVRVELRPFNQLAAEFVEKATVARGRSDSFCTTEEDARVPIPESVSLRGAKDEPDVTVLCCSDEADLSCYLMECVDLDCRVILAPRTGRYFKCKPLFLISIPKAGTHLLYSLVEAFGYSEGLVCRDSPVPGKWYCLEFTNSHTSARDFFVDTVRRNPFGNRLHPFPWCPAVFIYRNPLDIVVSEANYYHKEGSTAFHGYLATRSFQERLVRLIDDPWLLGSIRKRVGNFVAWLDFPNVAPVSFEELVGQNGGGSERAQLRAIWSLQLKLHIPGSPQDFAGQVFDQSSPTFHKGLIGAYHNCFTDEAYRRFEALPQDFMEALGYPPDYRSQVCTVPVRVNEFARRALALSQADFDETPILIDRNYLSHTIVKYRGQFYGIAEGSRVGNLSDASGSLLATLPSSRDLIGVQAAIIAGTESRSQKKTGILGLVRRRLARLVAQDGRACDGRAS